MARTGAEGDVYLRLTWDEIMDMCRDLAMTINKEFDPEVIIGIARGGVIPAAILASMLRAEFYPIRLSRRRKGVIVRERPELLVPMPDEVSGRRVLIMDEISATGETLHLAVKEATKKGARKVKTATLFIHTDSWRPTWYALQSDALIIPPWDYEILSGGKFIVHPEYQEAIDRLSAQ